MSYKRVKLKGKSPSVNFIGSHDGSVEAELTFYRTNARGNLEEYVVTFEMDVDEAACVGRAARIAVWQAKDRMGKWAQEAYDRIITPGS